MCSTPGTLSTHCISRSVPSPSSRSAYARASLQFPCWPAPRHTHTQSRTASKRQPVPTPGHYADAHPDLFVRSLPVLADGLGACVGRIAVSTTEPAEDPSSLSRPHAPAHIHVSPCTTLLRAPACGGIIACGWRGILEMVAVSVARLSEVRSPEEIRIPACCYSFRTPSPGRARRRSRRGRVLCEFQNFDTPHQCW
jgi:hypothetical protein